MLHGPSGPRRPDVVVHGQAGTARHPDGRGVSPERIAALEYGGVDVRVGDEVFDPGDPEHLEAIRRAVIDEEVTWAPGARLNFGAGNLEIKGKCRIGADAEISASRDGKQPLVIVGSQIDGTVWGDTQDTLIERSTIMADATVGDATLTRTTAHPYSQVSGGVIKGEGKQTVHLRGSARVSGGLIKATGDDTHIGTPVDPRDLVQDATDRWVLPTNLQTIVRAGQITDCDLGPGVVVRAGDNAPVLRDMKADNTHFSGGTCTGWVASGEKPITCGEHHERRNGRLNDSGTITPLNHGLSTAHGQFPAGTSPYLYQTPNYGQAQQVWGQQGPQGGSSIVVGQQPPQKTGGSGWGKGLGIGLAAMLGLSLFTPFLGFGGGFGFNPFANPWSLWAYPY